MNKAITLKDEYGNLIYPCPYYPVGAIYISVINKNPALIFGGRWLQIEDVFLLGCGKIYKNGEIGGESTHTLAIDEIPSHTHTQKSHFHKVTSRMDNTNGTDKGAEFGINRGNVVVGGVYYNLSTQGASNDIPNNARVGALPSTAINNNAGGGKAHNNMPPYLAVYIWKRIS